MSPLKSWLVEKPQPDRKMLQAVLVAVFAAVLLATRFTIEVEPEEMRAPRGQQGMQVVSFTMLPR
jgi:hypothetical protein